jgi:peptide/nickel transport system ATP-binding protein
MTLTSDPPVTESLANEPLLHVEDLTVTFPVPTGVVRAVNEVSFEILPGRILGVVGESGSGKSVTARSIMRMLRAPGRVDGGHVVLQGEDLLSASEPDMRAIRGKDVAMIFQDPQAALNPVMKIGDQIAEALEMHGIGGSAARARVTELLQQVGIPDVPRTINQYPHEFSGGMRQRVVIAIALANKPRLLIADEPTTALDVTIQAQILKLLVDLRRELGVAIMMITHDMGVVAELCEDVIVMYGGRVVESGRVRGVFEHPKHPYTNALLNAVPRVEVKTDQTLAAIPGSPPDPARLPQGCAFHPRCPVAIERCTTERPPLFEILPGQRAACWVSAQGGSVEVLPTPHARAHEARAGIVATTPILRVENLRTDVGSTRSGLFSKGPPVWAVNEISLEVSAGETVGLVGESGCGKSTLSRTIVGINRPASGRIVINGRDVTAMGVAELREITSIIQYVFQDPYASLNPRRTIGQSLEEALSVAGVTGRAARARAADLMRRVGLNAGHLDRYPFAFSGGQRQRVGIARALAAEPKMLICDEPVSALDVSIQAQIINLLEDLQDELGLGYLFIAHDLSVVRHISDRVAVMYLGRIVETGTAEQVYGSPQHPYTAALLSATPEPDLNAGRRERIVLTGDMPSPANPPSGCPFRTRCPIGPLYRPEREICVTTMPPLDPTSTGQLAACHFAGELIAAVPAA